MIKVDKIRVNKWAAFVSQIPSDVEQTKPMGEKRVYRKVKEKTTRGEFE